MVNRYHGTLTPPRIAPSRPFREKNGSIIIPGICIVASNRHHMICTANPAVIALRRSLTPLREVLASEAVLLRRSGRMRSTELFGFQGTSEDGYSPSSPYNGQKNAKWGVHLKNIFNFFADRIFGFQYAFVVAVLLFGIFSNAHSTEDNFVEDLSLVFGQSLSKIFDPLLSHKVLNTVMCVDKPCGFIYVIRTDNIKRKNCLRHSIVGVICP